MEETGSSAKGPTSLSPPDEPPAQEDLTAIAVVVGNPGEPAANGSAQDQVEPVSTKLCGYLDKLGGPLKSWKSRWFAFDERQCLLFYYRTVQDVNPLGRIELSNATFGYPLQGDEGAFHIQTTERTFVLKAASRDAKMYWLQQLQLKRWQHRGARGGSAQPSDDAAGEGPHEAPANCSVGFLPTVKTPPGLVGEVAASLPAPRQHAALSNVSFKHPLTEIQNSVHCLLRNRISQDLSRSVFYWELPSETWSPAQGGQDTPPTMMATGHPDPPKARLSDRDREAPAGGRRSPCSFLSPQTLKKKKDSPPVVLVNGKDADAGDKMTRLQQEVLILTEQLKAQKDLVCLLRRALEDGVDGGDPCGGPEQLRRSLAQRDIQVAELQEQLHLTEEKNRAKTEVVLKLSELVADCMADPQRAVTNTMSVKTFRQLQLEIEHLKDDIEAYKVQNKFLNSEIYQLTRLWRNSSEQENSLMKKCACLEARNCQTESRYLGMLQKLQETKGLDQEQREAVKKLVENALQEDTRGALKLSPVSEFDEYGFRVIPDYEAEDIQLLAKIQALESRSLQLLQHDGGDGTRQLRWAQYLGGRPSGEPVPSPELKSLLRGGVSSAHRAGVWRWIVWTRTRSIRERHPRRYQELCRESQTVLHPASRQIQLDLHRTLTSNQHFSSPSSPAVQQLHRVLLAFSWQNPAVGYCQGLNRLAAIALLVLQNEEEAFWCLVTVVETIMPPDYYSKNLIASQVDQWVLKDFMVEKMPRLVAHLEEHCVDVSLITFNWFLVVFVESLTSDILLRIWDAFLYEGTKVIFRYALALFKYKEEDILKIHDSVEIYQYLRFFAKTISDGRKLTNIAFHEMNPFPMKLLQSRRAQHLERLQAKLRDLERMQKEFVTESAEHKDKGLDTGVSEDDEDVDPQEGRAQGPEPPTASQCAGEENQAGPFSSWECPGLTAVTLKAGRDRLMDGCCRVPK